MQNLHQYYMSEALNEAKKANLSDEVPIGAVIVYNNEIIARAHNKTINMNDPTAHAEIIALKKASSVLGNYRLTNVDMYVTLEPCCMCIGALIWARIRCLIYGANDFKAGACGSVVDLTKVKKFNHEIKIIPNIMETESKEILQNFFKNKRKKLK